MRSLFFYSMAVLVLFVSADRAFGWFADRSFLPSKKLRAALGAGHGCIAFTGDSRMAAGLDSAEFTKAFGGFPPGVCVADLSQGGVGIDGQAIAVRAYVERGGAPDVTVLGTVPESLLETSNPDPSNWIGSEALVLLWSRTGDARLMFGGPPRDIGEFDARLRYSLYRQSYLAIFRSLLWLQAQRFQDVVLGRPEPVANRFGEIAKMRALGERFRSAGEAALSRHRPHEPWAFSPWLFELQRVLTRERSQLVVVELPMPSSYQSVRESAAGRGLRLALRDRLEIEGAQWIDLAAPPWASERLFEDGVHLGPEGAKLLSAAIARALLTSGVVQKESLVP